MNLDDIDPAQFEFLTFLEDYDPFNIALPEPEKQLYSCICGSLVEEIMECKHYEDDREIINRRKQWKEKMEETKSVRKFADLIVRRNKSLTPKLQEDLDHAYRSIALIEESILEYKKKITEGEVLYDKVCNVIAKNPKNNLPLKIEKISGTKNKTSKQNMVPLPLCGSIYCPAIIKSTVNLEDMSLAENGTLYSYQVNFLYCSDRFYFQIEDISGRERIILSNNFPWSQYSLNPLEIVEFTLLLPMIIDPDANPTRYIIKPTPATEYRIKKKDDEVQGVLQNERVFTIIIDTEESMIPMQVGPIKLETEFCTHILSCGMEDHVTTMNNLSFEHFTNEDIHLARMYFMVKKEKALELYRYFTDESYIIINDYIREQSVWIFSKSEKELKAEAEMIVKAVDDGYNEEWEREIVLQHEYPLRAYIMDVLCERGSTVFNPQFMKSKEPELMRLSSPCTDIQIIQLWDAYYWTYLAPLHEREDYSSVLSYFDKRGKICRLKMPHIASGKDVGRSVSKEGGSLRYIPKYGKSSSSTASSHCRLPSRHVKLTENGLEPLKIHPRKEKRGKKKSIGLLGTTKKMKTKTLDIPFVIDSIKASAKN